jgi:hypothetical protein
MLGSFSSLKSVLKFKKVKIDATIFRLSYKFSVTLMVASSILVTSRQFFGDPIDCVHTHDIPKSVLNTYCWIHSTYTIPSAFWKRIAIDVPHPGIDKTVDPDERRYIRYYQWVVFCLSFQVGNKNCRQDYSYKRLNDLFHLLFYVVLLDLHLHNVLQFFYFYFLYMCVIFFFEYNVFQFRDEYIK